MDDVSIVQDEKILKQSFDIFKALIDLVPDILFILDRERNVVLTNKALYDFFGEVPHRPLSKLSRGELLGCKTALETADVCGKNQGCKSCGISEAFLGALKGNTEIRECRLILENCEDGDETLNLKIWAGPCMTAEGFYILFYIRDISREKRQ